MICDMNKGFFDTSHNFLNGWGETHYKFINVCSTEMVKKKVIMGTVGYTH